MTDATILVLEDDPDIRGILTQLLRRQNYIVHVAASVREFDGVRAPLQPDLFILDVGLPDGDGFDVLRRLREEGDTPVIMLTGADTEVDRVLGLEFGADDYIGKPFSHREMLARVRNILRRSQMVQRVALAEGQDERIVVFGPFTLFLEQRRLARNGSEEVVLTSGEFALLSALAKSLNRPLTRDQILDATQNREWSPFDRSIDVLIGRLRRKLGDDPRNPRHLKTVRGIGYVLTSSE